MYNDGFGDDLTAVERIEQLERLTRIRAAECAHAGAESDDLAQEGRIAIWRTAAQAKTADDPRTWLSAVAARRIAEVAARQTWTGHTRSHGQPTDPLRQAAKQSVDDPDFHGVIEALEAPGWLDAAELSYHAGEIARAISELPPKQRAYVLLRFWGGYTPDEIEREFVVRNPGTVRGKPMSPVIDRDRTWAAARSALRAQLAHLAPAAPAS